MPRSSRDAEFSAFVSAGRVQLLRSACLLTAGDRHLAEDLVQTALARLYVAWPRVRRGGSEAAYARRIIVNAFLDETRRPRWRREHSVAEPPDRPDPSPHPALDDGHGVDGDAVRAALAELPPRMRAVVVLRYWLDLSVEETADLLGCGDGTVKSSSSRAVARLRELLSGPVSSTAPSVAVTPAYGTYATPPGHDPAQTGGRSAR